MSLKSNAIKSFNWTAFELIFNQGTVFFVGIILARLLEPKEFGIIGIITVFLAISNSIVEGGFSSALIRKNDANNKDYNTVFYSNLALSVVLYILLFLSSPYISNYFDIEILNVTLKIAGLTILFNSVSIIHRTILIKKLNFRLLALINILSAIFGGVFAIFLAYQSFGIWSLICLILVRPIIQTVLYFILGSWRPQLLFDKKSFVELAGFGYKVLLSGLINTIYKNVYYVVIGKIYSPLTLGYYTRAEQFQAPVSGTISRAISKISFPLLSLIQDDREKLKHGFVKFIKFSFYLTSCVIAIIAGAAKSIVLLLIGSKWNESIIYLQLMCIPAILYPLQILHLNLLLIKGYSNLNLKLEVVKKIILIPLIYITSKFNVEVMLYGLILFSICEYFINSFFTNRIIRYPIKEQLLDLFPRILIAFVLFSSLLWIDSFNFSLTLKLTIQLSTAFLVFILINEVFKLDEYKEMKNKINELLIKLNV